ncbi:small conductance mechanosensitive channel [Eubacterium ruminantium]|nr:small conductance mechanosensitive channel [Eubacterium ruminantium]
MIYNLYDIADTIEQVTSDKRGKFEKWMDGALDWIVAKGILLILTLIFLFIGGKLIKLFLKIFKRAFERRNLSQSVAGFLISFMRILMYALLFISAAALMGFQVTSFVTLLGVSGMTIGFGLQGSLANLAGGFLILILKPFDVGDYIIENSTKMEGTVIGIDIFYTKLRTVDNRIVVIPNGSMSNTSIINVSKLGERIVEVRVGIAYDEDMKKTKEVLSEAAASNSYAMENKPVECYVDALQDSSVLFLVRFWVKPSDYLSARWSAIEDIKRRLDEEGITIPFNQLDVHVKDGQK